MVYIAYEFGTVWFYLFLFIIKYSNAFRDLIKGRNKSHITGTQYEFSSMYKENNPNKKACYWHVQQSISLGNVIFRKYFRIRYSLTFVILWVIGIHVMEDPNAWLFYRIIPFKIYDISCHHYNIFLFHSISTFKLSINIDIPYHY